MENFTPLSALIGGALIGGASTLLLMLNGRIAGISGILGGLLPAEKGDAAWRILFLVGLVIGMALFGPIGGAFRSVGWAAAAPAATACAGWAGCRRARWWRPRSSWRRPSSPSSSFAT